MSFLENLYKQCIDLGFGALAQAPMTGAAGFTLAKEENTSLCLLQVMDLTRINDEVSLFLQKQELDRASSLNPLYSSIWVVFLTIGNTSPNMDRAEGYFGQSPYAVYWHIDVAAKDILVHMDQPDNVMNLRDAIRAAFLEEGYAEEEASADGTMAGPSVTEPSTNPSSDHFPVPSSAPVCTFILVAANIIVMILMYMAGYATMPLAVAARFGAIVPHLILESGEYYRLVTAMFVHFGWMHLFFNVAGILIFGTRIERYYGRVAFLSIYFISGLSASVASLILTRGFSAGASGAVYGLLGAAFVYTKLKNPMDLINKHVVLVYIIMGISVGFTMANIDNFGHLGGLIAGLLIGFVAIKLGGDHDS